MLALSTRIKRLTMLAVMLERLAANKRRVTGFHLSYWCSRFSYATQESDRPECGMTQCAGGFVAMNRSFRKLGVTATESGAPVFKGRIGFGAMEGLFGMGSDLAIWMFGPDAYSREERNDPLAVAKRVRAHLADLKNPA